jgi:hypothetical protein
MHEISYLFGKQASQSEKNNFVAKSQGAKLDFVYNSVP